MVKSFVYVNNKNNNKAWGLGLLQRCVYFLKTKMWYETHGVSINLCLHFFFMGDLHIYWNCTKTTILLKKKGNTLKEYT